MESSAGEGSSPGKAAGVGVHVWTHPMLCVPCSWEDTFGLPTAAEGFDCSDPGFMLNLGWGADCSGSRLLCPGGTGDSAASRRCPGVQSALLSGISYMFPLQSSEGKERTPGALSRTQQQPALCWPQSLPTFIPPHGQEAGPAMPIPQAPD